MDAEPVTPVTPRPVRVPVLSQWWRHVTLVHWSVDPGRAAALMPPGVRPDVFRRTTYVGLVALRMVRTRVLGIPPVPHLGTFPETNVRLYSVDGQGRRGVVFLSMDASRLVPVTVARALLRLPYRWSGMSLEHRGDRVRYACRPPGRRDTASRRHAAQPVSRMEVEIGLPVTEPSPLERFLTARWGLHQGRRYLGNEHPPWPLRTARLERCDDHLVAAAGLAGVTDQAPVSVLYSPGVYARFGLTGVRRHPWPGEP